MEVFGNNYVLYFGIPVHDTVNWCRLWRIFKENWRLHLWWRKQSNLKKKLAAFTTTVVTNTHHSRFTSQRLLNI